MKPTQRKLRFQARMFDAWADRETDPALRDMLRSIAQHITEKVEERRRQITEKRNANKETTSCSVH
jgi:hypothetical protein